MSTRTARFLARVGRRLRLVWGIATAAFIGPIVAATALLLVLIGRFRPWGWPEPAAIMVALIAALSIVIVAALVRISDRDAALVADNALETKDAFSTALEVPEDAAPFGPAVHARANALAATSTAAAAAPFPRSERRWAVIVALALGALSLAYIANPQDAIRAERAQAAAAIADQIEELEAEAERLRSDDPDDNAAADRIEELIADLETTDNLERAEELLAAAEAELRSTPRDDLLTQRAAERGLERSLDNDALTDGAEGSASEQLEAAAAGLDGLTPDETAALAERLAELAEAQRVGNPDAADALAAAAEALAAGDTAAAAEALGEAAAAQRSAAAAIGAQAQLGEAANAVASAREGLNRAANAGESRGTSSNPGDGDGSGSGTGDGSGSGTGDGSGSGSGSGSGQGNGAGAVSGDVSNNATTGSGRGSGRGSGTGNSDVAPLDNAQVTVGPAGGPSDEQVVDGNATAGDTETVGLSDTDSTNGTITVALSDVIREYQEASVDALAESSIPPSLRNQVAAYFDLLVEG